MQPELPPLIGEDSSFLDLMDRISHAAPMERPLLVIGERGTGKELIAARLHYLSSRWNAAFEKLNCAALPDTLLESELFGYEPGAFTGATKRRRGRFERADGGTLFLDEIGTLSAAAQEKLLRVIEYGEFERVGGSETLTVDVRIIGATNIDLPAAADAGKFRHDLLDRLAFDVITVPPLRSRPEDIPVLATHFGTAMARELEWPAFPGFTEDASVSLRQHDWPGNVRELKNVVERAVYHAWDGEAPIERIIFDPFDSPHRPAPMTADANKLKNLPKDPTSLNAAPVLTATPGPDFSLKSHMAATERHLIEAALEKCRHHQGKAATALGLGYDQMRHLMKKHGITVAA